MKNHPDNFGNLTYTRTRVKARRLKIARASNSEITPGNRRNVGCSWCARLPEAAALASGTSGQDSPVPTARVVPRRKCEPGTARLAAMRNRTLAESDSARSFDPRRKRSDRTGPSCYCEPALPRQPGEPTSPKGPIAMEARKGLERRWRKPRLAKRVKPPEFRGRYKRRRLTARPRQLER
jgi:hypothetical protein